MKRIKTNKILALLISIIMLVGMLPNVTFAEGEGITVNLQEDNILENPSEDNLNTDTNDEITDDTITDDDNKDDDNKDDAENDPILPSQPDKSEIRRTRILALLQNISKTYTDMSSYWEVMDMGAYQIYAPDTENALSEDAKQSLINSVIKNADNIITDSELAKAILSLTSVGVDATGLYRVNNNTPINLIEKLNNATHSESVWSAPYVLASYNREEYSNREKELALVNALLNSQKENGCWDEYGTIDTTANAIAGLSFYINDEDEQIRERVNLAISSAISYLSSNQMDDGTFSDPFSGSNSNSTAMVVIALSAAGIDLESDSLFIKNDNTILDGLLSFALEDNSGIGYVSNSEISAYSTEQGFRAFIAAMQAITSRKAYNVYDFRDVFLASAREKMESNSGGDVPAPSEETITVKLTIKTEKEYWLKNAVVTISKDNATVKDAFIKACDNNDIMQTGAEKGYVSSITKGDETLSEFSNGKDSGWLYKVNDVSPVVGIGEYSIKNGDNIVFYFTNDYNLDRSSSSWSGGGAGNKNKIDTAQIKSTLKATSQYIKDIVKNPQISSVGGEWAIVGLARGGEDTESEYFENYYKNVKDYVTENKGILHERKYSEYSRVVIALTAIGKNPKNVAGYNLLYPLADFDKTIWQGVNGPIWALIAFDSGNYEIPQNKDAKTQATREMYVNEILRCQRDDGGWSLSENGNSDADITGMALTALSKYKTVKGVENSIEKALKYLSSIQNKNGGFGDVNSQNCEGTAQVLVALSTLGISADDTRFVKSGKTVLNNLISYKNKDNSFRHTKVGDESNLMATEQCLYALVSYDRMLNGKNAIFDMTDVKKSDNVTSGDKTSIGEFVHKMPVVNKGKTFLDIAYHKSKMQIEELASRNIINGKSEDIFDPDSTMTRAEFTAIIVRGLGLEHIFDTVFSDVKKDDWHYQYISTAFKRGIVKGVSSTEFNPDGAITKEEASVMLARASELCEMNTSYDDDATRNILATFTDYIMSSSWARSSLAFCYDKGILDNYDIEIEPKKYVTRAEIAVMTYNLISLAGLK